MSSSRRARTLRARLIVGQVLLLATVCLVIGVATEFATRSFLVHQLDSRLSDATHRAGGPRDNGQGPPFGPNRLDPQDAPGQGAGTLTAVIRNGVIDGARTDPSSGLQETLSTGQEQILRSVAVDGKPHTIELGAFGQYRVSANQSPNNDGDVLIVGLPMADVNDTLVSIAFILGGVSLIGLLVASMAGVVIVRRSLRPLQRVASTASKVSELQLDRGEVALSIRVPDEDTDPRTEVGQVGSALNRMLHHVSNALAVRHASEQRARQFVADASHELRTPLAAIRGYAELAKRRQDELPPDVAHAIDRVESAADRMTTLVQDLLLLARLDSGRPLDDSAEVDLSRLVLDVVGDARVAGSDHRWQLDLPAEPVTASGDEARLHQVLANLLANARTHTPPGTTVTTGLSTSNGSAVLTVTDDGPGIPADLQPEVFERFARGDSSRSRAAGSTGLGLSIVAAVVHAHHGTVEVESRPGRTRFTVQLPVHS